MRTKIREANEEIDHWFQERPVLRFLVLAFVPGAVYTAMSVLIEIRAHTPAFP